MNALEWDDKYSVGIDEIDNDHREMIDIINKLDTAIIADRDNTEIRLIFSRLNDYIKVHFVREEELMKKYNYDDAIGHKNEHDKFIIDLAAIKMKMLQMNYTSGIGLYVLLRGWLITHIMGTDRDLGRYLNIYMEK